MNKSQLRKIILRKRDLTYVRMREYTKGMDEELNLIERKLTLQERIIIKYAAGLSATVEMLSQMLEWDGIRDGRKKKK
jgi:hypothetical protein